MAIDIPAQIGPCRIERIGRMLVITCPAEFNPAMRAAGADWDRGNRTWVLTDMRRLSPVLRAFRARTDPLFRFAGIEQDSAQ
jgi:hypothetical protein